MWNLSLLFMYILRLELGSILLTTGSVGRVKFILLYAGFSYVRLY
jgi:hypothetical protein